MRVHVYGWKDDRAKQQRNFYLYLQESMEGAEGVVEVLPVKELILYGSIRHGVECFFKRNKWGYQWVQKWDRQGYKARMKIIVSQVDLWMVDMDAEWFLTHEKKAFREFALSRLSKLQRGKTSESSS